MFGLRNGGGGYEGKNKFVYLKWASHFSLYSKFIFPQRKFFLVFGGRLVWPGGVGLPDPAPCPVDKHIPDSNASRSTVVRDAGLYWLCVSVAFASLPPFLVQ